MADVAVIGAGIVGLATARELLLRRPDSRVVVLEKEAGPAVHQTGHNSGVIHSGLYYPAGSLKAQLCREGREELIRFADEHGIPYRLNGKLVVALDASELPRLAELHARGTANGIVGLRELGPEELREVEPHVVGLRALHVPGTGSIDYREVARAIAVDIERRGGALLFGREVTGIERRGGGVERLGKVAGAQHAGVVAQQLHRAAKQPQLALKTRLVGAPAPEVFQAGGVAGVERVEIGHGRSPGTRPSRRRSSGPRRA